MTQWLLLWTVMVNSYGSAGYQTQITKLETRADCIRVANALRALPGTRGLKCIEVRK